MSKKQIFFSNVPLQHSPIIENMMVDLNEQLSLEIKIADFDSEPSQEDIAPVVILCDGINTEDTKVLQWIYQLYATNQAIVLVEPTNNEVNQIYRYLEGKNLFQADHKAHRHTLFGLKRCEQNICHILECHEKDTASVSESLIQFIQPETAEEIAYQKKLCNQAATALQESEPNLAQIANQHVITHKYSCAGKNLSLSYYVVSCHKYIGEEADGGEDWFFIQQHGILNGANGYDKKWAGTNQRVNNEKYYVGEGEVCLNYVDYYMMQNYIESTEDEADFKVDLEYAEPQAINQKTSYTISESFDLGGTIGFEGGVDGGDKTIKGSGSFSAGANFTSAYSFEVQDCCCEGTSLSDHPSSAAWTYRFKRASQNRSCGKWQYLHDPALLSHSAFSPWNSWIWKFPTNKRDNYKSFQSLFRVAVMNTISRYSGSQSPKHIASKFTVDGKPVDYDERNFEITLNMPPLIGVDQRHLLLSSSSQTQPITIISQGGWKLRKKTTAEWLRIDNTEGHGEAIVYLSVDELTSGNERSVILQLLKNEGVNSQEEMIEIKVMQSAGSVTTDSN